MAGLELFTNQAQTTVSSGGATTPSAGTSETWVVSSSTGFPAANPALSPPTFFRITDVAASSEKMIVTDSRTTSWAVTRGAESTTPVSHAAGFTVQNVVTSGALNGITAELSAVALDTNGWVPTSRLGNPLLMPWLTVSGTHVYEGPGKRYRATGYNFWTGLPAEGATFTTAQMDTFMGRLRPNSLVRAWAAASNPSSVTWATNLAYLDNLVAAAAKYGHRIILTLGLWGDTSDYYAGLGNHTAASWITGTSYTHASFGANSYQDWVTTVATRYAASPAVAIYDLMNEPADSGTNAAGWATFCSTASGWIKAVNPNALVYMGISTPSSMGGLSDYETVTASMDLVGAHEYSTLGYPTVDDGSHVASVSKPVIIDEYGFWAKGRYGSASDSDLDANGLWAMDWDAQAFMTGEFLDNAFSLDEVFAALIWSYQDLSPASGPYSHYAGLGAYEPVNDAPAHEVIRTRDIGQYAKFNRAVISNVVAGFTSAQALRYADGTNISGANGLSNGLYDRYYTSAHQYTQTTSGLGAVARHGAVTVGGAPWPSLYFGGSSFYAIGSEWKTTGAGTLWAAVVPASLPAAGTYAYLEGPSANTADAAVRINPSGAVELVAYSGATGGTIVASGGTLTPGHKHLIMASWVSGGAYRIDVDTVTVASGTAATTYTAASRQFCAAHDGTNGFTGHVLEAMKQSSAATEAEISLVNAYLTARYGLPSPVWLAPDGDGSALTGVTAAHVGLTPSTDTSGATSAAAINAALAALPATGGVVKLAPTAQWYIACGSVSATTGQYIDATGCNISAVGAGAVFRFVDTNYFSHTYAGGGLIGFPTIDGTSTTGNSYGIHAGDILQLALFAQVQNFTAGTTSKGVWLDNNYFWTEQAYGRIHTKNCTAGVVFDNSANTSGQATGSFDRANLDIHIDESANQDGVVFQNGTFIADGKLGIFGNFSTTPAANTGAVLRITGVGAGGSSTNYSNLTNTQLIIGCEADRTYTNAPYTIYFGSSSNTIYECFGSMDFGAYGPFTPSNYPTSSDLVFTGPINGDAILANFAWVFEQPISTAGGLLLSQYEGAVTVSANGQTIAANGTAYIRLTSSAAYTGLILTANSTGGAYGQVVVLVNEGAFPLTFAATATSNVADGLVIPAHSQQTYIYSHFTGYWYTPQPQPYTVTLASTFTASATGTAAQNVTGLSAALGVGTWKIRGYLPYQGASAAGTTQFGFTFSGTAGANSIISWKSNLVATPYTAAPVTSTTVTTVSQASATLATTLGAFYEVIMTVVVTAAGTLQLQTYNLTTGDDTKVLAGAFLDVAQVS